MTRSGNIIGKVENGKVQVPPGARLKEGTPVALVPLTALPGDPPFLKLALKLAKPRVWPESLRGKADRAKKL